MPHVVGRPADESGVGLPFGRYRAADGSAGAPVAIDAERPHVGLVVGKRGSGKSYTLGVLAEGVAAADGVRGVVVDPMGVFASLADRGARVVREPSVPVDALPPAAWCDLLNVDPTGPVGALLWRATAGADTLADVYAAVRGASATEATRRAARNYLDLAEGWGVFGDGGRLQNGAGSSGVTVLDLSGFDRRPANAVVRAVAATTYRTALAGDGPLPWLFVDEAHVFTGGVAAPALRRLLTRGRQPGASLVLATQRPSVLPGVAASQADIVVAHHLTSAADVDALTAARPTYLRGSLTDRLPRAPGDALLVDDVTESVHGVRVRERETPHGGGTPRASARRG